VSLPNSPNAKFFTKKAFFRVFVFLIASTLQVTVKAWDLDMSRRKGDLQKFRGPASEQAEKKDKEWLETLFQPASAPMQEVVILNTEKGFIPENVRLKKGGVYKILVVNVNSSEKNTSFVLDAFSEHHGTYFGQPKSFDLSPKTDGVFSFLCPETSKQGRIIVYTDDHSTAEPRKPASE